MTTYLVYGVPFATALPFRTPLPLTSLPPRLHLVGAASLCDLSGARHLSSLPEPYWNAAAIQHAYQLPSGADLLLFPDGDQIEIADARIIYRHEGTEEPRADFLDVRLLGAAFAWWLLRQGRVPLHAGAVVVEGEAVLVTAESGTGKSSLLCALLDAGYPLLADDFVALHRDRSGRALAAAAYPQMRMWPETIERWIGSAEPYPTVAFGGVKRRVPVGNRWGAFLEGAFPVTRIYLLQREARSTGPVTMKRVEGHASFMRLLTSILMAPCFPDSDLPRVWPTLQTVANQVSFFDICYPSGWSRLPDVVRAVVHPDTIFDEETV